MSTRITPVTFPPETERWIPSFRFLFELHTVQQQVLMEVAHREFLGLSGAEMLSQDSTLLSANGFPIPDLIVVGLGYEMMDKLKGDVDLLSGKMAVLFGALSNIGVYGSDPAGIATEIARIKSNVEPT